MTVWASPLGTFQLAVSESGISRLSIYEHVDGNAPVQSDLADSLTEHLFGRPASLRLDLQSVHSSISQLTLAKLLEIPYAEIRSYAWVAKEIGHPTAVRAVANAIAANPLPILIPCHRVVRSDGHLGEYSLGAIMKQKLLEFEGLDVNRMEEFAARNTRFLADKETNMYHVPSCKLAPVSGSATLQELQHVDQAIDGHLDPCRRCRPVSNGI